MKKLLFLLLCGSLVVTQAETHITGDISEMQFDATGNPYIVEQDILVPNGKKVVLKEGCVFLFKAFTGLHIQGHLIVQGTNDKPVVFTSLNDGEFNLTSDQLPNPFDWNGILVSRDAGTVSFSNFILRFSVYGIKSQNQNIQIVNGLFKQNGQFHFTINDKIQYVQDNLPYSFNATSKDTAPVDVTPPGNPATSPSKGLKIFRYASLGVGGAGVLGCAAFGIVSAVKYNDMKAANELPQDEPSKYQKFNDAQKTYNNVGIPMTIITGALGAIGLAGFGISFAF